MLKGAINPVDTHDWYFIPTALNAVCNRCGCQLMPAFRGVGEQATEVCKGKPLTAPPEVKP